MRQKRLAAPLFLFLLALLAGLLCLALAERVQRSPGAAKAERVVIGGTETEGVSRPFSGVLYLPESAAPVPGVLLLYSGRNDAESAADYALELSRRGYAVLTADCRDAAGATAVWRFLGERREVLGGNMAVGGFSAAARLAWRVAEESSGTALMPQAVLLLCGELPPDASRTDAPAVFNVLLLQARFEEHARFRDGEKSVSDDLLLSPARRAFLACPEPKAAWNETYGYFGEGTARRMELIPAGHLLAARLPRSLAAVIDWLGSSLGHPLDGRHADEDFVFPLRTTLGYASALCFLFAAVPAERMWERLFSVKCQSRNGKRT